MVKVQGRTYTANLAKLLKHMDKLQGMQQEGRALGTQAADMHINAEYYAKKVADRRLAAKLAQQ